MTFAIPPTRLIQLDIDEREIGKNYPVAVPLVGDAKAGLQDLLDAIGSRRALDRLRRRDRVAASRLGAAGRGEVRLGCAPR